MSTNISEQTRRNMIDLLAVMPGVLTKDIPAHMHSIVTTPGFDEGTYRRNINLSDWTLSRHNRQMETDVRDWWIMGDRMGDSAATTLDMFVHFEDDTYSQRVIGSDVNTNRILCRDGKVYQLGRRLVAPIEVAVTREKPFGLPVGADLLASNALLAKKYVERRHQEAMQFFKSLSWTPWAYCGFSVMAEVYGVRIVHEMQEGSLHAGKTWGELFFLNDKDREPIIFQTFENFLAYMLAKNW